MAGGAQNCKFAHGNPPEIIFQLTGTPPLSAAFQIAKR